MKVDLDLMEQRVRTDIQWNGQSEFMTELLALIRVARAAKALIDDTAELSGFVTADELRAALSDIEDSQ